MKVVVPLVATVRFAACLLTLAACGNAFEAESAGDSSSGSKAEQRAAKGDAGGSSPSLRVAVIDVGKGDCILLQPGNAAALIDTGYKNTADDVLERLQAQGVDHLDSMIITHYDRDHVDGMRAIGESVDVGTIYLPEYEGSDKNYRTCMSAVEALDVPTKRVTKELTLSLGSARLTLYPSGVAYEPGQGKVEGNDNDMSLVATLTNGNDSYLFAGDLEEDGIDAYLAANHGQFDVVKMPHHGQHSSNTSDFLDDVRPQIAVITDGKDDPASKKTLKLLESADVETYCTSTDGTVIVESDGRGTYSVSTL